MEVYLFPLGQVVFYPSTSKPLNIFESQYLQMVRDSLETGIPIAIGYVDEPQLNYIYKPGEPVGFVREIAGFGFPMVLEHRPDGSMLIFLQGKGKVRLGKVKASTKPYIVCEAQVIEERHEINQASSHDFVVLNRVLVSWVKQHVPDRLNQEQFLRNIVSPEEVIGCFASYLVADHDMQQLILETNDINDKIQLVNGLIASGEIV